MKMKKLLSMVLALAMLISMMSGMTAFAVWEDTVTLFEADFENETVGEAPRTVNGNAVIATTTDAEVVQGEEGSTNTSKFMNVKGNNKVRMWFNESVSEGTIVAEFDLNGGQYGNVYLGVVYERNSTAYSKYPLFLSGTNVKSNKSTGTSGDYVTTFTKEADNTDMQITRENWHNYKVKIDLTNKTVKAWVDGIESNLITDYTYFTEAIGGMAFYIGKAENKSWVDNIKIYKENSYGNYYINQAFEKIGTGESEIGKMVNIGVLTNDNNVKQTFVTEAISEKPTENNTTKYLTYENAGTGAPARIMFADGKTITTGKFYVEFDVYTEFGGVSVGIVNAHSGDTIYAQRCIFGAGTTNSNPKRFIGLYKNKAATALPPSSSNKTAFKNSNGETMVLADKKWEHVKLEVDMDNESVKCTLDGVESNIIDGISYLDTVAGIAFRWATGGSATAHGEKFEAAVDNVKVYTLSNGESISDAITGSNVIKVALKDTISAVTANDIKVTDAIGTPVEVSDVELGENGKDIFVTLAETPEEGDSFIVTLANSLKYADGYDIVTKTVAFDYIEGSFAVNQPTIETISFKKGDEVVAKCVVDAYNFTNNTVKLYIASYQGGILKDVNVKDISVDYKTYGEISDTVTVTLTENSDLVKAFVWDNNLIPYVTEAEETPEA